MADKDDHVTVFKMVGPVLRILWIPHEIRVIVLGFTKKTMEIISCLLGISWVDLDKNREFHEKAILLFTFVVSFRGVDEIAVFKAKTETIESKARFFPVFFEIVEPHIRQG